VHRSALGSQLFEACFKGAPVPQSLIAALIFIATLLATAYFVAQARELAKRLGLFGRVGHRHLAPATVPRIGGVGIFLGVFVGIGLSFVLPVSRLSAFDEVGKIVLMLVGGLIVFAVSLVDDLVELSAPSRLLWLFAAAGLIVLPRLFDPWREIVPKGGSGIIITDLPNPFGASAITLPLVIAIPFTLIWIVGMTNAINWIDAVDGLAGGVVLIGGAVLFIHTYFRLHQFTISLLPLVLGAAALGFLRFNWHPASIIMGDCGAMFLGYALAVAAIIGGAKIATTLLVLIVPAVNMVWAILVRLMRRANPMRADESHLHYQLLRQGFTARQITLLAYAVCIAFGALALVFDKRVKLFLFAVIALTMLIGLVLLARQPLDAAGAHKDDDPARIAAD